VNRQAAPPSPPNAGDLAIEIAGLTKTYRGDTARKGRAAAALRPAVSDLSLCVRRGDVFGFLGANGAGKTTTVKMLLGFHTPTAGSAALFGVPIGASAICPNSRIFRASCRPAKPFGCTRAWPD